ncbi:alkaline phosphatase family protein [Halobacteriales archaeon Cl-PHB]
MPDSELETLLVGLDAACLPVLEPLLAADRLPTLARLVADGASGPLTSQIPPWTPSAWPSLYTGTNPGKHGVFDFLAFDGYDWAVVDAARVHERPLWETLDHHGLTSAVVNVPVTHPPGDFDGALVPGYTAPENPTCHPEGLLADLRRELGAYRVYPRDEGRDAFVDDCQHLVGLRASALAHLVERVDADFGFVQFQVTDTVFHTYPGDAEAVATIYEAVDDALAGLLETCDPDTVVLASDHGMGEYTDYELRVNEFLRREGFVETTRGGAGMPSWATVLDRSLRNGEDASTHDPGPADRALALAASVGLTTQRVAPVVERLGLTDVVSRLVPSGSVRAAERQVDFPASTAYMRSRSELGVRLNLVGREPEGVVPEADYEAVRADLADRLRSVETPGGDPVFERVVPREVQFDGPHVDRAPDLVTIPHEFEQFVSARLADEPFGPPSEPWNHKLEGLVSVWGDGVPAGDVGDAHLFDVAPTVLATLGVPAANRMDGRVLDPVGAVGSESYPPYRPVEPTDASTAAVADRLSNLGYIE